MCLARTSRHVIDHLGARCCAGPVEASASLVPDWRPGVPSVIVPEAAHEARRQVRQKQNTS